MLKKKADALKKEFNEISKMIVATKKRMGKDYNQCQLDLAQANFAAGDFGVTVRDSVKTKTQVRLVIKEDNIAGVKKPTFVIKGMNEGDDDAVIGLTGGGQAIMKVKKSFTEYLRLLVQIASYQTQYVTVDRVIQVTNRRVNALEFVVIPQIEWTIKWIEGELDELDREDFYRLKCVQDKKKEAKEEEEAELAIKKAKNAGVTEATEDDKANEDIFAAIEEQVVDDDDADVIF